MSTNKPHPLTSRALLIIQQERSAFGLRSNDYARYRKHCGNKVHRLRQTLKMTHGRGREFKKLPVITADTAQDGHLQLLLFESERAYAHAQELLLNPDTRRHALARFRRAAHHSLALSSLIRSSSLPASARAEVAVYHLTLCARLAIARRDEDGYEPALVQLAAARGLLAALAAAAGTSRDVALYTSFGDELAAEVRFVAHELGHPRAWDIEGVVGDVKGEEREGVWAGWGELVEAVKAGARGAGMGRGELRELVWEGREVPVRNPEMVDVLMKVQVAEAGLASGGGEEAQAEESGEKKKKAKGRTGRGRVGAYDGVLLALSEAEEVARRLAESVQSQPAQDASGPPRDIHFLHSYITYRLLAHRAARDLLLVGLLLDAPPPPAEGKGKEREREEEKALPAVVKLLDTVLQSLEQMRGLSVVEESLALAAGVDARLSFTRAKRIYYLARIYGGLKQYAEALALLGRGQLYLRETLSSLPPSSPAELAFYPLSPTATLPPLQDKVSSLELAIKNAWFNFDRGGRPELGKPVFYDVAFNYVRLPMGRLRVRAGLEKEGEREERAGREERAEGRKEEAKEEEVREEEKPQAAGGSRGLLSGYLGSWWGRK